MADEQNGKKDAQIDNRQNYRFHHHCVYRYRRIVLALFTAYFGYVAESVSKALSAATGCQRLGTIMLPAGTAGKDDVVVAEVFPEK